MLKKIINILLLLCCCAWASAQSYRIGDVYTAPDGSKGIVYYLHPDGSGGWVVALKDTSMRAYSMFNSWYEAVNAMDTAHGWELPSWTQLNMLFAQLPFVSSAIINAGGDDLSQGYYWSSDEESESSAYMVSFSNGSLMSAEHKTYPCHVRAVRSFIYPTITSNTPLTYHWNTDSTQAYIIVSPDTTTTYTVTVVDTNGCSGTAELTVVVKQKTYGDTTVVACESFTWHGIEYTETPLEAPTFTIEGGNHNGCDSIITLNLTINHKTYGDTIVIACDSFTWHGIEYTETPIEAPTFTIEGGNHNGCDSIVTLNLTVNKSSFSDTLAIACDSLLWHGKFYTETGTYNDTLTNAVGCDSIVTLNLTIKNSTTGIDTKTACDSYTWIDGVTYTESNNTATYTLTNAAGCDSIVTLNLTVNKSSVGDTSATACDIFFWHGNTYTVSGDYYDTLTNAAGCDSVVTLHLTVNYSSGTCVAATDYDGNIYDVIQIGQQCWMKENLRTTHYADGTSIALGSSTSSTTAYRYYPNNNGDNVSTYGYLYNWKAVMGNSVSSDSVPSGVQGVCPRGWHVPSNAEWTQLTNYVSSQNEYVCGNNINNIAKALASTAGWNNLAITCGIGNNPSINNATGFGAMPAGNYEGTPVPLGTFSGYWSATQSNQSNALGRSINIYYSVVNSLNKSKSNAYSVRCLRDYDIPNDTISVCDNQLPYIWNGDTLNEEGTYSVTLQTIHGCDSMVRVHLTINHATNLAVTVDTCDWYTWRGNTYYASGDYMDTLTDSNGCTQVDTLHLTINNPEHQHYIEVACEQYTWHRTGGNDTIITHSGDYTYSHEDANGCTQVDTLHLTINNPEHQHYSEVACETYTWHRVDGTDTTITQSGDYTYSHEDANGCTQVDTLHLTINNPEHQHYTEVACEQYIWHRTGGTDTTITHSGDYTYSHEDANGCTQVDTLHLTINNPEHQHFSEVACETYTWHRTGGTDTTITQSGDYTYSHEDANGCTQVDTLHLTINNPEHQHFSEVACETYTWHRTGGTDTTITQSGDYTYSHEDANGCTQVDTLHLTINNPEHQHYIEVACEQYTWHRTGGTDTTIIQSGDYTYSHEDANGCTQVDTLHLTINNPEHQHYIEVACEQYTWHRVDGTDTTITQSGDYTYSHEDAYGCIQVDTLHLTINNPEHQHYIEVACEQYTWHRGDGTDTTITQSGDYTYSHEDANGCIQVDTLHLTINNPVHQHYSEVACEIYTWHRTDGTDTTITQSGDYTYSHEDANGCIQVDTLHLTINNPEHQHYNEVACEQYTWHRTDGTDTTITQSGDYTYSHEDANGCTQVDTLHLTINNPEHQHYTEVACEQYTWHRTGGTDTTITQSGDYTYSHEDANGCTQVDTLHLTINNPEHQHYTEVACEQYTWHRTGGTDTTITHSGDYTYSHEDANGCTQVDTLHLTINNPEHQHYIEVACVQYTWHRVDGTDTTITQSGDYTYSHEDANGCTQVDTLHLTINPSPSVPMLSTTDNTSCTSDNGSITVTAPVGEGYSYSLNDGAPQTDNSFTALIAGLYTITVTDSNGCSSSASDTVHTVGNTVTASASVNSPCENDTLRLTVTTNTADATYAWTGPADFSSSEQNPIITNVSANNNGLYTVIVTETSTGCSTSTTTNATIKQPVYHTFDTAVCVSFTWNDLTYETSGDYTQTFTAANGCDSVITLYLTIYSLPDISITGNDIICYGDSTELVASEGISYNWNTNAHTQSIFVSTTGTYIVTVTDEHNCSNSDTMNVTVRDAVTIATATQSVCPSAGETIVSAQFSNVVSDHSTVTWSANNSAVVHTDVITSLNNIDTYTIEIPQNLCNDSLFYTIEYADGICTATATQFIHVVDTIAPLITGTLPELQASGCSIDEIPAAYNSAMVINSLENISISDNCTNIDNFLLSYSDSTISSSCEISVLRTYTITDACGNSSNISQNIIINRPNTFTISQVVDSSIVHCESQATIDNVVLPVVTDACGITIIPTDTTINEHINSCEGTRTFSFLYENCADADTTWIFTFHIVMPEVIANMPADGERAVSCLVDVVRPTADTITDICGNTIVPIFVDSIATLNVDGTGNVIFTYSYTDCAGHDSIWTYTFTINPAEFTPAQNDTTTVHCISEVHTPTLPNITNCGASVTLTEGINTADISNGCGDTTFVYSYRVNGTDYNWSYTYHVVPEDFAINVENGRDTVNCLADVVEPTAHIPVVTNNCGTIISHGEPVIDTVMTDCEGTVTYTYSFTDCVNHSHNWTYTYVIELPVLNIPQNGTSTIVCAEEAAVPTPVTLTDACGREITAAADTNNPTVNVAANGHGTVTYNYIYTDCAENSYPWQFVYTVIPEEFTPIAHADTIVHCAADIHTPATPDLSVCGNEIEFILTNATFINGSDCGDSVYTFSYMVNDTTHSWTYTYHIVPEDFAITVSNGETSVHCLAAVSADSITLPNITDACGNILLAGDVTIDSSGFNSCQGDIVYNYPYIDCAGNMHSWNFTFHIALPDIIAGVPNDGNASVPCLADVSRPSAQVIEDVCGNAIMPVFVDSTADIHYNGTGTVIFRYSYTDCAGNDSIWTFSYTLNPESFTPIADDTTTVHCISDIHAPTLPIIPNCGTNVPLEVGINTSNISNGCGDSTFVYTYYVNGTNYTWSYTYHVVPEDFDIPSDSSVRVQCIAEVVKPMPPEIENNCGTLITPVEQAVDSNFNGCYGQVTYSWLYNDCTLEHPHVWSFTYIIKDTIAPSFTVPADISICKNIDGTFDIDTAITGAPHNLYDNCLPTAELTVAYSDSSTSLIGQRDTVFRIWTVSDHCQSTSLIQHIYLNVVVTVHLYDTLCAGEIYDSHGFHIVAAMDTVAERTELSTITHCDSITKLHLTVNHSIATGFEIDTCDFYVWNGQVYHESGNYTEHFQTIHGCDSTVTMFLTIYHSTDTTLNISVNENDLPYILNGSEYYWSDTYIQIIHNAHDCDSVITLVLSVNGNVANSKDSTICENDLPLVWNDVTFYAAGDSAVTLHTATGADSVLTMHVHVNPIGRDTLSVSICHGSSYHFGSNDLAIAGTYADTTRTALGCDSITVLHLTIEDYLRDTVNAVICHGSSYHFGNNDLAIAGTYSDTTRTALGCDSITVLHLTIEDYLRDTVNAVICHGASYAFGSNTLTIAGTYADTTRTALGCDSITVLHLTIEDYLRDTISVSICHGSSYHFGSNDLAIAGTYADTTRTALGCDSITVLHLTIEDYLRDTISVSICHGSSYAFGSRTLSEAGTYADTTRTALCCDSITVLHLTIEDYLRDTVNAVICHGSSYAFGSNILTAAGTYADTTRTALGCDSITVLHLTIEDYLRDTINAVICHGSSYAFGSRTLSEAGTYADTTRTDLGCDSITVLHLTRVDDAGLADVLQTKFGGHFLDFLGGTDEDDVSHVVGQELVGGFQGTGFVALGKHNALLVGLRVGNDFLLYAFGSNTLTIAGTYADTTRTALGCDSITVLHLTIEDYLRDTISVSICHGSSYHFGNNELAIAGTYADTTRTAAGCDSITVLHLTIEDYLRDTVNAVICHGSSYHFGSNDLAIAGTYSDTTRTALGCDSIIVLHLTIEDYLRDTVNAVICHGSSYAFGSNIFTAAGTYADTTRNALGCDSITVLHLTIEDYLRDTVNAVICHGSSYHFGINDLAIAGTYSDTTRTADGCESITVLHLTIEDYLRDTVNAVICHGSSYAFGSNILTAAGTYADTTRTALGCDSITVLLLTIEDYLRDTINAVICHGSSYHFGSNDLAIAGTYADTTRTALGCDSITVLHLTIEDYLRDTVNAVICHGSSYQFGSNDLAIAGTYADTTRTAAGCDSITVLHLTIEDYLRDTVNAVICHGSSYHFGSNDLAIAGTYADTTRTALGCDSIIVLHLTIEDYLRDTVNAVICHGASYAFGSNTLTAAGTYADTTRTADGCESITVLHLTVNYPQHSSFYETACESFDWNGQTYTTSGTYTHNHNDENGCAQVDTLHLTINHNSASEFTIEECENYSWNNTTYTESGDYTQIFPNSVGCDSTVTLHLTINHPQHLSTTISACESYEWNGQTHTSSGTYTYNHEDENGCVQVDTLHLTVNFPLHTATTEYVCHPYQWNDQYYYASGSYTFLHEDENGCEQVDTLHLNFVDTTTSITSLTYNFCDQESAILEVNSVLPNIEWSTGETTPIITVFESGLYTVTASQGQCAISREFLIKPCERELLMPNAFTPNGDGNNDVFCIPEGYLDQIDDNIFEVSIYDRWGELVYVSHDKHFRWNGEVKGRLLRNIVYTYLINFTSVSGVPQTVKGTVIVL